MIKLQGVTKEFGQDTLIKLKESEFISGRSYCILGPSGSGKSTLLNMIAGIVKPSSGKIYIGKTELCSLDQASLDNYRYEMLGYISQDFKLFEDFTVLDNLLLAGVDGSISTQPKEVLNWVGLHNKGKSKVKTLSGGEKQRVAIARALIKSPRVMLCDEPTGSLNWSIGVGVVQLLIDIHQKSQNTLIVVTHDDRLKDLFDEVVKFEDLLINRPENEVAYNV